MDRLWRFIFKKSKFITIENIVIAEIKKNLKAENIRIYSEQLKEINHIERVADRESNFYKIKFGAVKKVSSVFTGRAGEFLIARVFIQSKINQDLKCDVWMVDGFIFSIEYDKNVYEFEKIVFKNHVDVKTEWLCDL